MKNFAAVTVAALLLVMSLAGEAQAKTTITLKAASTKSISGDVLWMRLADESHAIVAPFTLDYRGLQCWAPASVFEESCTVTVSRRKHGKRTLVNGSGVDVRVTYARHY